MEQALTRLEVTDLLSAATVGGRVEMLRAQGLDDEAGLRWLLDHTEDLIHDDPPAADALAEVADGAADHWPALQARARYQRARVSAERGQLDRALELIEQARSLWLGTGDELAALRTDLGRMQVLDDLGRHADAATVGETLIATLGRADHLGDPLAQRIRAHAVDNVGAAYGFTGAHERALEAYAEAERAYRALGMVEAAARPLANRGVELLALGRPREALQALQQAVDAFLESGDRLFAAQCQGDMALAHQQLGELMESLALLEPARQTLDELGAHAEADRLQLTLAETYLAVGLLPEAAAAAEAAGERTRAAKMVHDHARARYLVALTHLGAGDVRRTESELQVAADGFRAVSDRQYLAKIRLAQAEAAALDGRLDDATVLGQQAARALVRGGWRVPLAWAELRLADWAVEPKPRRRHIRRAIELAAELRMPELDYQCELHAARLDRLAGDPVSAENRLHRAIVSLDRVSAALADHALRTAFRADRLGAHDELVDLLLARGEVIEAAAVADEAKARTLRDLMSDSVGTGPDPTGESGELSAVHADLNATYATLHQATEPSTRATLHRQAERLEARVGELRLRQAAVRPDRGPVSVAATDAVGAPDALAFHVLGRDVVAFVRQGGVIITRRLPDAVPLVAARLDELGAQWARFGIGRAFGQRHETLMLASTLRTLQGLYDVLLRPVQDLIEGFAPDGLTVVPHTLLGLVPFHALHDGDAYLVERMPVRVAPTLPTTDPGAITLREGGPAAVFAVPDDAAPAVTAEAYAVARAMGGLDPDQLRLRIGPAATTGELVAQTGDAALVHLACHGLFRAGNPLFSRLRLHDRWLTSAEVLHLALPDALVVLSACESGRHGRAAEPVGLGWAFLATGAAGVVVSQWLVHDDTARSLMTAFYAQLVAGRPVSAALRTAQLAVAAERPHPYHWAPFSFLASPVATPTTSPVVSVSSSGGYP